MSEFNATCHLCGKKYQRCDACDKMNHRFVAWKQLTDTEDHFKIFSILRDVTLGKMEKTDAVKALKVCDLSDIDSWVDEDSKKAVKALLAEKSEVKTASAPTKKAEKVSNEIK